MRSKNGTNKGKRLIDANRLIMHLSDWALTEAPIGDEKPLEFLWKEHTVNIINGAITTVEQAPTEGQEEGKCSDL